MKLSSDLSHHRMQPITGTRERDGLVVKSLPRRQQGAVEKPLQLTPGVLSADLERYIFGAYAQHVSSEQGTQRSRQAIASYTEIAQADERSRIRKLLGLDEFA
ncbi:MAG: hypothetical protein KDI83_09605 [Gammaproteobacteria bacterium]|nr:hypothetical protein [Gammaproteobacteria bacterium]